MEEIFMMLNMYFVIKNDELKKWWIEKCNKIWDRVSKVIKKGFDSDPVYNDKYVKTKIKSSEGKIKINFHDDKVPKEGSQYICLSVILIGFVFRAGKNYYPQAFLEECKHVVKEKKIPKYIIKDMEISANESDNKDSDEENSVAEISNE